MKQLVERMIVAALKLQVAALEWGDDETPAQPRARQALDNMQEALNTAKEVEAFMEHETERRRELTLQDRMR